MAYLKVIRPFQIQCENGASVSFRAGDGYVPDEFADHWLVKANTVGPDDDIPEEPEVPEDERTPAPPDGAFTEDSETLIDRVEAPEPPAEGDQGAPGATVPADPEPPAGGPDDAAEEPVVETPDELAKDAELEEAGLTKEALAAKAAELGVSIDKRWGAARIQAAIDAAAKD